MKKAWNNALIIGDISAGFVATGICPFNPGVIPDHAYLQADLYVPTPLHDQSYESTSAQPVASTSVITNVDESRVPMRHILIPVMFYRLTGSHSTSSCSGIYSLHNTSFCIEVHGLRLTVYS